MSKDQSSQSAYDWKVIRAIRDTLREQARREEPCPVGWCYLAKGHPSPHAGADTDD